MRERTHDNRRSSAFGGRPAGLHMIWLLILLPSAVMVCILGIVYATELTFRRGRR